MKAVSTALATRYSIERELGTGAMATVYLAHDLKHRREVAIKVLRRDLAATLAGERFLREIEIAARLQHPHILGLIDSGRDGDILYYVMPYVKGESLRTRLGREGELSIAAGLRILAGVAEALAYAHARGVVHRDVKPENILLTDYSGRRSGLHSHPLVADFGIAKAITTAVEAAASPTSLTDMGVAVGTPAYMAPEQASADPHSDHRADIYSFGIVAYEIFGGAPPFSGPTPQHVIAAHMTKTPDPLSGLRPAVPAELEDLVMRCVEKRPADRWQTADEIVARLDQLSAPHPSRASSERPRAKLAERTFRLSPDVCRQLNRETLDPRLIGGEMRYHDNNTPSDTIVFYLHSLGSDGTMFETVMRESPYRGIAATMFGFEPDARQRVPLSGFDHAVLIRELIREVISREHPRRVLLVGFSSGSDVFFEMLNSPSYDDRPLPVDGFLALSPNLSLETCFVSRVFAKLHGGDAAALLDELRQFAIGARTLHEWLNVHEYLVRTLRKFQADAEPLQPFSADICRRFEERGIDQFVDWYRAATARVSCVLCVFEDTETCNRLAQQLRLRNLDEGVLGERYRDESLVIEPGADHFDLADLDRLARYIDETLARLAAAPS
ncbi:MAG: serine/threonine-protein kinase [Gemmatimonadaceae bacterium]